MIFLGSFLFRYIIIIIFNGLWICFNLNGSQWIGLGCCWGFFSRKFTIVRFVSMVILSPNNLD